MSVDRRPNGAWRVRTKEHGEVVYTRTWPTKREADEDDARQRRFLKGGIDPRAGKQALEHVLAEWMTIRGVEVAQSTRSRDASIISHLPSSLIHRELGSITSRDIQLLINGMSTSLGTKQRVCITLKAFFSWCVRDRRLTSSPMTGVRLQKQATTAAETMNPFTLNQLTELHHRVSAYSSMHADDILVLADTGLRWGEFRALKVDDVECDGDTPTAFKVRRSWSEGMTEKPTKSTHMRRVPLSARIEPIVRTAMAGKKAGDRLFTTVQGTPLHKSNFRRSTHWDELAGGHRLHDLRHTAATNWLQADVPIRTVQTWLGHESVRTTQVYTHYLGSPDDARGIAAYNRSVSTQGPQRADRTTDRETDTHE